MTRTLRVRIGRIIGIAAILVLVFEFRGVFVGNRAFYRKPTLVLSPIHAPSMDEAEIGQIRTVLERELAAGGRHALYPKSLIENFYLERDNATGVFDGSYRGKTDAFELGAALGVERIAIASVLKYGGALNLYLTVYDIATDQVAGRIQSEFPDYDSLLAWTDAAGEPVDLTEAIGSSVPGMGVSAWLYLAWLSVGALAALALGIRGTAPRFLLEGLLGGGLLLSLFSWIYALNGDMDYVQRFVATSGILDIADTGAERSATLWRYLAPMGLLTAAWILDAAGRMADVWSAGAVHRAAIVEATAPLWAVSSAFLFALALPNFLALEGWAFLAWVATAPLYVALRRVRWGRGVALVLLFTGLQALLVNWWQGTFSYVSLPFTVALMLIQFLPFALLLAATIRFFPTIGLWAAPLLWTAFDGIRSLGFLGYPWGLLGVSQYAQTGLIQMASIGGVWMVSAFTHFGGAALALGIDRLLSGNENLGPLLYRKDRSAWPSSASIRRRFRGRLGKWLPTVSVAAAALLAAAAGSVTVRIQGGREGSPSDGTGGERTVRILLVQQNTDPRKHDYRLSFEELSRLTDEASGREGSFDLVAWPESGFVPDIRYWRDGNRMNSRRGRLVTEFLDWQAAAAVPLVTGTQDHFYEDVPPSDGMEEPGPVKRIRNSAMYLAPDRIDDADREYYYKMRLVPFTENFPYGDRFPWVAELLHNFSTTQWTPGTDYHVFRTPTFRFSTPICFEDVFPDHVRRYVRSGTEVLVNMSNDYWANTPLEGYQHGAHAVFRAVENRRPLVRATCSGWTISVDPYGRIAPDWPAFYEPDWTVAVHRLPSEPRYTLYTRFGDWFPVFCGLLWAVFCSWEWIFRRTEMSGYRR